MKIKVYYLLMLISTSILTSCSKQDQQEVFNETDLKYKAKLEKLIKLTPVSADSASRMSSSKLNFKSYKETFEFFKSLSVLVRDTIHLNSRLSKINSAKLSSIDQKRGDAVDYGIPGNGYTFFAQPVVPKAVTGSWGTSMVLLTYNASIAVNFPPAQWGPAVYSLNIINPTISYSGIGSVTGNVSVLAPEYTYNGHAVAIYSCTKNGVFTLMGSEFSFFIQIDGHITVIPSGSGYGSPASCMIVTTLNATAF